MIHTAGDKLEPFTLGTTIANGNANMAKYNFFIVVVRVPGKDIACPYNRGQGKQNYGIYDTNNIYMYWTWIELNLSGNTFSVDGSYYSPRDGNTGTAGYHYDQSQFTLIIYGIV